MNLLVQLNLAFLFLMKRSLGSKSSKSRGGYEGAGVSPDTKLTVAHYAVGAQAAGVGLSTFLEYGESAPYTPKLRTLQRHAKKIKAGDSPLLTVKKAGGVSNLTIDQREILGGWILVHENEVSLGDVRQASVDLFGVIISAGTSSAYIKCLMLSVQLTGRRSRPKDLSKDSYVRGYFEWVKDRTEEGFFTGYKCNIGSMDFFTNSRRLERKSTISGVAMKQKKLKGYDIKWTDGFLVCLWADGYNWTPCLLFTFNPAFDPDGPRAKEIQRWCDKWGILRSRIYYLKHEKHYCKESNEQVQAWCDTYADLIEDAKIMHDAGNSFKVEKTLIVSQYCQEVQVYPPAQHGELSTCDNWYNAVVKSKHKKERRPYKDDRGNAVVSQDLRRGGGGVYSVNVYYQLSTGQGQSYVERCSRPIG